MSETRFRPWPSSHALARWGWAVAVVVVALQTATHLVNALVLDRQRRWLDAAVDASIFGRMNTVAIGLCALFALLMRSILHADRRERAAEAKVRAQDRAKAESANGTDRPS